MNFSPLIVNPPLKPNERGIEMSGANSLIKPACPAGVRDLLPDQTAQRESIIQKVIAVYQRFGFVPLETSALEREEVLTGGDPDFGKQIFRIADRGADREKLALRFDLTVPLARVVAQYPELPKPFKRYQLGRVFRGEKPQAGRYREFAQLDADIVGSSSVLADIEVINMIYEVMLALGISRFLIRVNTRKLLNALPFYAGFDPEKISVVLRIMDKLEKIGEAEVRQQLSAQPQFDGDYERPGLSDSAVDKLMAFVAISGSNQQVVARLVQEMSDVPEAQDGIRELQDLVQGVKASGIGDQYWKLDLSVARGLGYYTGPVFETTLLDLPEFGSVFSGGRFDGLIGRFGKQQVPATGASVGVDRLFTALEKLKLLDDAAVIRPQVMVTYLEDDLRFEAVQIAAELRGAGIRTELYMGRDEMLGPRLGYASARGVKFTVILGATEFSQGKVGVRDMASRTQQTLDKSAVCARIAESLR